MKTKHIAPTALSQAAEILKKGGLCAIPTETVYGLAADALNPQAVADIFTAKGRPQDNPLIVHICDIEMLRGLVTDIPETAEKLAAAFWPGPLTLILPKSEKVPDVVSAGLSTVAVRMPSNEIAREVIRLCDRPLAAPSANTSGLPSPTTAEAVAADMDSKIDAIVMGGACTVGVESTVLSLVTEPPRILRPGGVTAEMLRGVIGEVAIDKAVFAGVKPDAAVASPGMKYKHYAPKARLIMVESDAEAYRDFVNRQAESGAFALCFDEDLPHLKIPAVPYGKRSDPATQAHGLFAALRRLDTDGCKLCYAAAPEKDGLSMAVYNRLIRACAFEVICL
ncbi:MAG: threonylcarbamoyl-AMP synthase [Clostridia bacterium]|nr:threonylcarbamoyl-AMP synthase [Clostridia bacterium]